MAKAVYAGSFDPVTEGHLDIIRRVSPKYSSLYVAVGTNIEKSYTFSLEERLEMLRKATAIFPNVIVDKFSGLLVDYAYANRIDVIVRGIRNDEDLALEKKIALVNKNQNPSISTVMINSLPEHAFKSSSAAKELQRFGGNLIGWVPLYVKQKLEEKISDQYLIGLTGGIASGKTKIAELMVKIAEKQGISAYNIELDHLAHHILSNSSEPLFKEVRQKIEKSFPGVTAKDGSIDRKILGRMVFSKQSNLQKLEEIMYGQDIHAGPMAYILRQRLYGKKGLVILNAALIVEKRFLSHVNNNIILVGCSEQEQARRLMERDGFSKEEAQKRIKSQHSYDEKKAKIQEKQKKDNQGILYEIDNSKKSIDQREISSLFTSIISDFGIKKHKRN